MKKLFFVALLAAIIGALVTTFFAPTHYSAQDLRSIFPDKTAERISLKAPASGEAVTFKSYTNADAVIPTTARTELTNGDTNQIAYNPNGLELTSKIYYPERIPGAPRQLRFASVRTPDGLNFVSDQTYRPDGTTLRKGGRLADGNYQIDLYFADGISLYKHQIVTADLKAVFEKVNFPSGAVQSITKMNPDQSGTVMTFYEDGKRNSETVLPKNSWEPITSEFYFPDGQNVRLKVSYQGLGTNAEYFRDNGTLRMTFDETFHSLGGTMVWRFFDAEGNPVYEQKYLVEKPTKPDEKKKVTLREVNELNAAGESTRNLIFRADGTPERVVLRKPAGHNWGGTYKTFRADGTLEKSEERNLEGNVVTERSYAQANGIKESYPDKYLTMPTDALPPPPVRTPAVRQAYHRGPQ
ncbi:MAG: hypothetical protein IAF58_03125 [Leptolyngbya sp.]|nr:hypothetical protein [Candidatus Melainabacteria bacterium]